MTKTYSGGRDNVKWGETRSSHRWTWKHWIRISSDRKELWCRTGAESTQGFTESRKTLNFLFPIWGQDTAVMENKKADGKGWSSNKELYPTSRGESLKYSRHHTNGWHCTIMCSAMQRSCLSSNTTYPTTPCSGSSSATRSIEHQQKIHVSKEFIASSSMQSHILVCFIPAREFEIPGELLASDPHILLTC